MNDAASRCAQPFGLTRALGQFAAGHDDPPQAALDIACIGLTDAVGVMLAGRNESVVRALRRTLPVPVGEGDAHLLCSSDRASMLDAALINGTSAHALAMDDVAAGCHPSSMLMAALFAQAQTLGKAGIDVLRAYVVGYEVLSELSSREPDPLHMSGWHPTAVLGPVAVAAAAASLGGLNAMQCTHALGLAASMSGGVVANFGTQAKALHVGRAAQAGLFAVQLAAAGVEAAPDALESPTGLLRAVSPNGKVDLESGFSRAPADLRITRDGISIKQYPVCYSTHRVVDAAIGLTRQPDFVVDDIERIDVTIGKTQAWMARNHRPATIPEAKYSVEFAAAAGLAAGAAGFAQLSDAFIRSPVVRRLIEATHVELCGDVSDEDAIFSPSDRVIVHLKSGRRLDSGEIRYALGNARNPLQNEARRAKFVDCALAGGCLAPEHLYEQLARLQSVTDLSELVE